MHVKRALSLGVLLGQLKLPGRPMSAFRLMTVMSLKDPNVPNAKRRKRVAIVLANPAVSTTISWPVGFWWSELSHPYFLLTEKGYEIELRGRACPCDGRHDVAAFEPVY